MRDSRNVYRGHCTKCGPEECNDYELSPTNECAYCKCPPTLHQRLEEAPGNNSGSEHGDSSAVDQIEIDQEEDEDLRCNVGPSNNSNSIRKKRTCASTSQTPGSCGKKSRKGIKIPTSIPTGPGHILTKV